jgi:hypothetical protein
LDLFEIGEEAIDREQAMVFAGFGEDEFEADLVEQGRESVQGVLR